MLCEQPEGQGCHLPDREAIQDEETASVVSPDLMRLPLLMRDLPLACALSRHSADGARNLTRPRQEAP